MTTPPLKRCVIVGTAESWRTTPFNDPSLEVWSLNDAYALGLPRAERWFELHPLDRMYFRDPGKRLVSAADVPAGHYVRPHGHLEWLQQQAATIPVYLQQEPPAGWPANAKRFPLEDVTAAFGSSYWASGPSYMLALAVLEGYREIWITGIHLATAAEYREQRPQWEHLLGRVLGPSVTESTRDGFRIYDGHVRIVLPEGCPILTHGWRYAFDPKPTPPPDPLKAELKAVIKEKDALIQALVHWPTGKDKAPALARLARLDVIELDIQQQRAKRQVMTPLQARVA